MMATSEVFNETFSAARSIARFWWRATVRHTVGVRILRRVGRWTAQARSWQPGEPLPRSPETAAEALAHAVVRGELERDEAFALVPQHTPWARAAVSIQIDYCQTLAECRTLFVEAPSRSS